MIESYNNAMRAELNQFLNAGLANLPPDHPDRRLFVQVQNAIRDYSADEKQRGHPGKIVYNRREAVGRTLEELIDDVHTVGQDIPSDALLNDLVNYRNNDQNYPYPAWQTLMDELPGKESSKITAALNAAVRSKDVPFTTVGDLRKISLERLVQHKIYQLSNPRAEFLKNAFAPRPTK